ncbi:SET domain-containing protein [Acephala macrosclerotiorum]|nr:SET domain-containing protein [Acephala macrosclerotiorum]
MSESDMNSTTRIRTANAGNGLAAATLIPSGALILKISDPHLILLEKAHLGSTCSWCFIKPEKSTTLKICAGCKIIRYCSATCQKNDWQAIHKKECKVLKALPDIPPTPTRALMQVSLRHRYGSDPDPRWEGLVMNEVNLSKDRNRYDQLLLQAIIAAKYTGRGDDQWWMSMGSKVLCQMETNAFRVTLPDDTPIGLCFEPTMALANHSCSPNAVVVFDGRTVSFRALNEIKQGEEIFISYLDPTSTRDKRRRELQYRYFFECNCEKCSKDENTYQTYLRVRAGEDSQVPRRMHVLCESSIAKITAENCLFRYAQEARIPRMLQSINEAQTQLDQHLKTTEGLPPESRLHFLKNLCTFDLHAIAPYPATLHSLYLTFLDMESWVPALICLLSLAFYSDPFTYPSTHHPVRFMRLFAIAKLISYIASLGSGEEILKSLKVGEAVEQDAAEEISKHICELEYFEAWQVLMGIVEEEVGTAFGKGSRFAKEVDEEIRKGRTDNGGMHMGPANIDKWLKDPSYGAGKKEAEKVVNGLKKLAGCVDCIVSVPL